MGFEAVVFAGVLHAVILAHLLQFAVVGTHTGKAFFLVGGQNQFQCRAAGGLHFGGVGLHFHPFGDRIYTRSHETTCPGSLYNADTAGADFIDIFQETKGGNFHPGIAGGLQDGGTLGYLDRNTVNLHMNHVFHFGHSPSLNLYDRAETAFFHTGATLDAGADID